MMTNPIAKAAPTASAERILILDSLRGIAVLGILLMNIPIFAFPRSVIFSPNLIDLSGLNFYAWYSVEWLLEGSQRALFSMLFGAGMLLFIYRLEDRTAGTLPAEYFLRRQLWLLVFGLFNAYVLLWPGDILFHYAIIGMVLMAFRKLKPKHLLMAAFVCLMFQTLRENANFYRDKATISKGEAISRINTRVSPLTPLQKDRLNEYNELKSRFSFESKKNVFDRIIRNVQGPYPTLYNQISEMSFRAETTGLFYFIFFDVLVFMFIGMAFYKNGWLMGRAPTKVYASLFIAGMGIGLVLSYFRLQPLIHYNYDNYIYTKNVPFEFYELSRTFRALGIFGGLMLLYRTGAFKWLFRLMQPVGQMAFTNYLTQSLICGLLFYGVGFGLYGKLQYHQIYYVVAAVWVVQIVWSHLWLRYFRYGPTEWLWRSLTYWKKQPIKKSTPLSITTQNQEVPVSV